MSIDIVGLGETLGLITPQGVGRPRSGTLARLGFGGAETNALVGARRLGTSGAWLGAVGDDALGRLILDGLRASGIDVSRVLIRDEAPTAAMVKYSRTTAATHVDYLRAGSAFSTLDASALDAGLVGAARVLHTSGITPGLGHGPLELCRAAIEVAHEAGVLVSLDVNHRTKVWGRRDPRPVLVELAGRADVIFASLDEARLLVDTDGDEPLTVARALARLGPRLVVLKLGAEGALAVLDGDPSRAQARPVSLHDAVGAGDALVAGVLVGWLRDFSAQEALQLGVDLGSYAVTVDGDHEGAPDWEELRAFRAGTAPGEVAR